MSFTVRRSAIDTGAGIERAAPTTRSERRAPLATAPLRLLGLAACAALVLLVGLLGLFLGTLPIDPGDVLRAFYDYDPTSREHIIVRETRVDRTLAGIGAGAAFAVSGALMQALTRNPLADPGILGINGGAALAIVVAVAYLDVDDPTQFVWLALLGGAVAAVIVYLLGSVGRGGASPVKLALAGATFAAFVSALTSGIVILDTNALDVLRFWTVGSLVGRPRDTLLTLSPFVVLGLLLALGLGRPLNTLALGEEVARSLGQRVGLVRALAGLAAILLAGVAVAAVGPIAFVGLVIPHIVRGLVGPDERWMYPYAALLGAVLVVVSDIVGRLVVRPDELEVGIVTAIVGAPFFIYLVRRRRLVAL